jgi:hypothetical protein
MTGGRYADSGCSAAASSFAQNCSTTAHQS